MQALAIEDALEDVREGRSVAVPMSLRDPHSSPTSSDARTGGAGVRTGVVQGEKYRYSHSVPGALTGQDYLGVEKIYKPRAGRCRGGDGCAGWRDCARFANKTAGPLSRGMDGLETEKSNLRREVRRRLAARDVGVLRGESLRACERLLTMPELGAVTSALLYIPIRDDRGETDAEGRELDAWPLLHTLFGEASGSRFRESNGSEGSWTRGGFGVWPRGWWCVATGCPSRRRIRVGRLRTWSG